MNNKDNTSFASWLNDVARIALEYDWCIEPNWEEWWIKYNRGISSEAAVEELFKSIKETDEDATA